MSEVRKWNVEWYPTFVNLSSLIKHLKRKPRKYIRSFLVNRHLSSVGVNYMSRLKNVWRENISHVIYFHTIPQHNIIYVERKYMWHWNVVSVKTSYLFKKMFENREHNTWNHVYTIYIILYIFNQFTKLHHKLSTFFSSILI